jgi:hypothetical protein
MPVDPRLEPAISIFNTSPSNNGKLKAISSFATSLASSTLPMPSPNPWAQHYIIDMYAV